MHSLEVIKYLNQIASGNVTWVTYIPEKYNNGNIIHGDTLAAILRRVEQAFGAYTFDPPSIGVWTKDGKRYKEQSRRLSVSCKRDRIEEAKGLVKTIGIHLGQECMYFAILNDTVDFIETGA